MNIITNQSQFIRASRKLAENLTCGTALQIVTHNLKNTNQHVLASTLEKALPAAINQPSDTARASELLAQTLFSENASVVSKKLKAANVIDTKNHSNPFGNKSNRDAISAVEDLSKLAHTLAFGNVFSKMVKDTFKKALETHGLKTSPSRPVKEDDNSFEQYIEYIAHLMLECPVASIKTYGMTECQRENDLRHYDRSITVGFENGEWITLLCEWSVSNFDGLRLRHSGSDIVLNGDESKDYFPEIKGTESPNPSFDLICLFLETMIEEGCIQDEYESDFCNIADEKYKKLIPILEAVINI